MAGAARALARKIGERLQKHRRSFVTAESCTGGLISATITEIPGSSSWFEHGYVTYSNAAKMDLLNVDQRLLIEHGAVSQQVVEAMLLGAIDRSGANMGIAVSGVAGPGGGSEEKPVGTVWLAWGSKKHHYARKYVFVGDRRRIRRLARIQALENCLNWVEAGF